ncbi:MAG TPA: Crp/Fnr family transcriptional regulator [Edaphobacter sp.]|jgi:CRP/FNR family transcriptional regulator|nr:Crp/Fnr family transcriptional regulator [Edaphobacter sp.]
MGVSKRRSCLTCEVREGECFCALGPEALRELDASGSCLKFFAGESVLHEGDSADRVYVVCRGRVKLMASSAEGRLLLLRIAGPGDVLGLAAALKETKHQVTVEALEACEVKAMDRAEFFRLMDRFRDVSRNAAKSVALEYEGAMVSVRRLAFSGSAARKLTDVLLQWARVTEDEMGVEAIEFSMPFTHEELGNFAGLSRETVTRLLSRFKREGLLEQEGERMILRQPAKMKTLYR